jgi:hypothetical protein
VGVKRSTSDSNDSDDDESGDASKGELAYTSPYCTDTSHDVLSAKCLQYFLVNKV